MKAVVIGTGRMGKAIIKVLAEAYPSEVALFSRSPEKAKSTIDELAIRANVASLDDVFAAETIIHTLWYNDIQEFVVQYRKELSGKILVDICNPFNADFSDFVLGPETSAAEEIQKLIPDTKVVGAFKNTYWVVFDQPDFGGIQSDIYVTADNEQVRLSVMDLLKPIPFRIFDAGKLKNNRTIERMTLLEKELATRAGHHPRVSFHLWGVGEEKK